jgi:hypothetical protein
MRRKVIEKCAPVARGLGERGRTTGADLDFGVAPYQDFLILAIPAEQNLFNFDHSG